jgi:hypothetical protein
MLGYVMAAYHSHGNPTPPWSIWLNFNKTHTAFELRREHFTDDGQDLSPLLLTKIESIDPSYRVRGQEPVVVDPTTRKRIPIRSGLGAAQSGALDTPSTFFDVLDQAFMEDCADK